MTKKYYKIDKIFFKKMRTESFFIDQIWSLNIECKNKIHLEEKKMYVMTGIRTWD